MFGGPEVSYHQTCSARDWLPILRTSYKTQNLQRKHRTVALTNIVYIIGVPLISNKIYVM